METRELRIGNLISTINSTEIEVNKIGNDPLNGEMINGFEARQYKPIPLTEEWLIRFGFDGYSNPNNTGSRIFRNKGFRLLLSDDKIILKDYNESRVNIKYVHQLQNLHVCLTGEDIILMMKHS